jgi:hypothetical protein
MHSPDPLLDFALRHVNDEWDRLISECKAIPPQEFQWRPDYRRHSIGWHVRHVAEWRYALVHVLICGNPNEERLSCLGWEHEPVIQRLSVDSGWQDPEFTVDETLSCIENVREITNQEIISMTPSAYGLEVSFPWRKIRIIDEILQDTRHSALHRGQVRELRKAFAEDRRGNRKVWVEETTAGCSRGLAGTRY